MTATGADTIRAAGLLATWLSPGYPVGAYSYSHGLEREIDDGVIADGAALEARIEDALCHGGGWSDAVFVALGYRAAGDPGALAALAALAEALAPTRERHLETMSQGGAFARVTGAVRPQTGTGPLAYPLAVARAARAEGVALDLLLPLYLHAFAANLVSAGVRLIPLGQTEGQAILARLLPLCERLGAEALTAREEDLGGCAYLAEIASMRHETQYSRLFRS